MTLEDTAEIGGKPERLRFIEYKGQEIFLFDLTNCNPEEMLLLLEQIKAAVEQHERGSLLILADFTGTHIDKKVATRAKEVLVLDRPYVKKSAWVGTERLPQAFYQNFKTFSQRELPTFKTREEALEWLTGE
jgi:SpoIIAA-like